jgi:hypothetical protein
MKYAFMLIGFLVLSGLLTNCGFSRERTTPISGGRDVRYTANLLNNTVIINSPIETAR